MKKMSMFLILMFYIILGGFQLTAAQEFKVIDSSPMQGEVNVGTNITLSITFNNPLHDLYDPELALLAGPGSKMYYEGPYYSEDDATISWDVIHYEEAEYVWVLTNAFDMSMYQLDIPFILRYTVSDHYEDAGIYGEITYADKGVSYAKTSPFIKKASSAQTGLRIDEISSTWLKPMLESPKFDTHRSVLNAKQNSVDGSVIVFLMSDDFNDPEIEEVDVIAAVLVDSETGEYNVDRLRPGTYYPLAVANIVDGLFTHYGWYDPDNTGNPTPITLETDQQVSGIDIQLYSYEAVTAGQLVDEVLAVADSFLPGFELKTIFAPALPDYSGKGMLWTFLLYHPELEIVMGAQFMPMPFGLIDVDFIALEDVREFFPADEMNSLPANMIDSDVAFEVAEQNGGAQFREDMMNGQADGQFLYMLAGSHAWWAFEPNPTPNAPVYWDALYLFFDEYEQVHSFEAMVDIETGTFIPGTPTSVNPIEQLPVQVELLQNYPNPFNPSTTIPYALNQQTQVRLSVYNLLGQQVAVLANGMKDAGTHTAVWDAAGFASGLYIVRLEAGTQVMTKKMVLMK